MLAALALLATPSLAQVKLSQIYGAGGNSLSPWSNDFIELYNSGAPQDVTGWSVQYASSTGTTWAATPLPSMILGTGQYLLVHEAAGVLISPQTPSLPAFDALGTIAMSATDFKVALVSSITPLVGGTPTYLANPTLVDFVGAGTANWNDSAANGVAFLSANNAPPASAQPAIYRRGCGSQDTNVSKDDWAVGFVSPRNSLLAVNLGITTIGTALPLTVEETQTARLTTTPFRCGTIDLGAGTIVTIDMTSIGGGAAVPMLDDGIAPDEIANDGIYTVNATIPVATSVGTKNMPVSISDAGGNSGASYISLHVSATTTPDNDNCFGAQPLVIPSTTAGTFTGATVESNPLASAGSAPTTGFGSRRGLWYSVVGTGNTLTASLCATAPALDSVIFILGGTCDGLTVIATGDDNGPACTGSAGSASWCSALGQTYWVWIAPFSQALSTAAFTLDITDSGLPCGTAMPLTICTGVSGPYTEVEPGYGMNNNDGCASTPNRFTDIPTPGFPGTILRGTSRGMMGNRDVDSYRFQATVSDTLTMTIDTLGSNAQAQLNTLTGPLGVCPQTPLVPAANTLLFVTRCATGIQTVSAPVTAGTWYVINVVGGIGVQQTPAATFFGGQMPGGTTYQYRLSVAIGGPPANDNCASASALTLQAAYTAGSTSLASNDGTSSCDLTGRDLWYNVTTPAGGPFTMNVDTCGSSIDTVVTVYNTCGGAEVICNDDCGGTPCSATSSCLSFPAAASTTYKIRVSDKGIGGGGAFAVRAQVVIANDTCAGALTIVSPSSTSASTVGATLDAGLPICDGPGVADSGGNNQITAPSVWYRIVGTGNTMYADTLVAGYDTKISIYQGPCGSLSCVTVNDDVPSTPSFRSKVAWRTLPGVEYFVMVHGFGTGTGTFTLNVTDSPTPSNDDCGLATVIGGGSGSVGGTNVGATGDPSTITSSALATCATVHTYWDTWYAWTAPCSDNVTFGTCGGFDTILSVHSTCPTLSAGNMIVGACNNDGPALCAPGSEVTLPVIGGTTYMVRVATAGALTASPGGGSAYSLTWSMPDTDVDGTIDCLDGCPLDPAKIAPGICGCGVPETDTDGDGTPDCIDGCPLDPAKIAAGICGCGVADTDTDGDGTPDCNDGCPLDPLKLAPGTCGCGVPETDTDGDGTPDCIDGCPLDPLKLAPGACGCGVPDTDGDSDGVADCIDNCPVDPNPSQADCDGNGMGDVCEISGGFQPDCDANGIPDNCDPDCNSTGLPDACDIAAATSFDLNGNGVPDECEAGNGVLFCFGDVGCPCGNNGLSGEGCVNGTGRGALLYNAGGTSVFLDNAAPLAIQMRASKPMMFVLGASQINGGLGTPFFDGKLCVSVTKRFQPQTTSPTGTGVAITPVSQSGGLILPGSTWYFQSWFRDQPGVCGTGVNLSNGLGITFTP